MKKYLSILAAFAAIVACTKTQDPTPGPTPEPEPAVVDVVSTATLVGNDIFEWNAAEVTYLRLVVMPANGSDTTTAHIASTSFTRKSANVGEYKFTLDTVKTAGVYNYVAVYPSLADPKGSPTHGVRYGGTDSKNRVSYILNHTVNQVPAADGPERSTFICMAQNTGLTAQPENLPLEFRPVVGFAKMTVKNFPALATGETVSKITVTAPAEKIMTGRVYHYFRDAAGYKAGDVIKYNDANVKNYVMIDPKNITFNTTGFDVWFTSFPVELAAGEALALKVETSASEYTANLSLAGGLKIEAGKVAAFEYDYEAGQPKAETMTLTFDFSTCPAGWPSGSEEYKSKDHTTKTHPYVLGGTTYTFTTAVCLDLAATSTRSIAWGFDGTNAQSYFVSQPERFFGLPAIEGWKLITFKFTQACSSNTSRKVCITSAVTNQTKQSEAYVQGGEPQAVTGQGTEYTFNLSGTAANTVYYFAPTAKGNGFATITLVYEKVKK